MIFDPPVGPLGRIFGTFMALLWRILALILLLVLLGELWAHSHGKIPLSPWSLHQFFQVNT